MKFTTLIPTSDNHGVPFDASFLGSVINQLWKPFKAMSEEREVIGRWTDPDGKVHTDFNIKISIECDRERLDEARQAVIRAGRRLGQLAMYFEIVGYDGVQIIEISRPKRGERDK